MNRTDRKYKDLKQKQKGRIAEKTYKMYLRFYLQNQRMPDASEKEVICRILFIFVQALAPKTQYEDFCKIVDKREAKYEERILRDMQDGITLEKLDEKKRRKTPEEKAAILKKKRQQKRAKRNVLNNRPEESILEQDDTFFFIAGYTAGGAPYGVTWEEMGLNPWQEPEDEECEDEFL